MYNSLTNRKTGYTLTPKVKLLFGLSVFYANSSILKEAINSVGPYADLDSICLKKIERKPAGSPEVLERGYPDKTYRRI